MLPFGLKISWFILSLTGLLSCWVIFWSFGRVVGTKWASMIYCLGTTLAHGIFCLGMVYRMDPSLMSGQFCLVQNALMSAGGFIIMGVVFAFTRATSMAVRKPKTWGDAHGALRWQKVLFLPVVVVPVLATTSYLAFSFSLGSVIPSDGMWCDSTEPEWVRLLGPSGIPFLLSIPVLCLSIQSILRIRKTNRHLLRSRPECPFTGSQRPITRRKASHVSLREVAMMPVNLALTISKKSSMRFWKGTVTKKSAAASAGGVGVTMNMVVSTETRLQGQREGHSLQTTRTLSTSFPPTPLPLALLRSDSGSPENSPSASAIVIRAGDTPRNTLDFHDITRQSRRSQSSLSLQDGELDLEDTNSIGSSSPPTFAFDGIPGPIVKLGSASKSSSTKDRVSTDGERLASDTTLAGRMFRRNLVDVGAEGMHPEPACRKLDLHTIDLVTSESVSVDERQDNDDLRFMVDVEAALTGVEDTEEDLMEKRLSLSSAARKPTSMVFTLDGLYKKPKQQPAGLAPALWRVILFQLAFVFIQCLTFLTTFVDVASGRQTPSRFGSQHLALLLAAWCPVLIFGSLPAVRRNLIPWRPISIS